MPGGWLPDELFKISLFRPFNNDKHFIFIYKAFNVANNEFMLQLLKQLDLFHALVSLLLIIHVKYLPIYSWLNLNYLTLISLRATYELSDNFWALKTTENFPSPVMIFWNSKNLTYWLDNPVVSHYLVLKLTLLNGYLLPLLGSCP